MSTGLQFVELCPDCATRWSCALEIDGPAFEPCPVHAGEALRQAIYEQLGAAAENETVLEHSWMKLGALLVKFKAAEYWRTLGYQTFADFMLELRDKYNRGRTQLWSYLTVAEKLLPIIPAATLEEIGITKALEIKRALASGKTIPPEIIEAARKQTTTIKELRAALGAALNFSMGGQPGTWFDFNGTYLTAEEREEFRQAVKLTITLLEIAPHVPEHIQRKEIFFAWLREFIGTHAAEVYAPQAGPTESTLLLPARPDEGADES